MNEKKTETRAERDSRISEESKRFVEFAKAHPEASGRELAGMLGVTHHVLQNRFRRAGYSHDPRRQQEEARAGRIRELVRAHPDWDQTKIEKATGYNKKIISQLIRKFEIPYTNKTGKWQQKQEDECSSPSAAAPPGENNKRLNRDAAAAKAAGMSYGQWRAMQGRE